MRSAIARAPQETAFCAADGCGRLVRRPLGAASVCAKGHEIPATNPGWVVLMADCVIDVDKVRRDWSARYLGPETTTEEC